MTWHQVETVVQGLAGVDMINIMNGQIQAREYEFVTVEIELVWFVSTACRIFLYQQQLVENGSRIFPSY